jgi:hypothetical protein
MSERNTSNTVDGITVVTDSAAASLDERYRALSDSKTCSPMQSHSFLAPENS